jgi:hypothetical protein
MGRLKGFSCEAIVMYFLHSKTLGMKVSLVFAQESFCYVTLKLSFLLVILSASFGNATQLFIASY